MFYMLQLNIPSVIPIVFFNVSNYIFFEQPHVYFSLERGLTHSYDMIIKGCYTPNLYLYSPFHTAIPVFNVNVRWKTVSSY